MSCVTRVECLSKLLKTFCRRTRQITDKLPIGTGDKEDENDVDEEEEETKREEGDADGSEEEWKEIKVEMVECEVPIKVWPGNTAFKATEVVFEV